MIMLPVIFVPRLLSVVTSPKFSLRASASDVTRFVPPGFLDTTTASRQFGTFRLIHLAMMGSA